MGFGRVRRVDLTVHIEGMAEVVNLLKQIVLKEGQIMATMQEILDETTQQGTVADSVLAIVQQLAQEQNPTVRQQLFDQLKANRTKLEAAILAGTPQAP